MAVERPLHEVSVALHVHSRYSDGTGRAHDIVRAAQGLVDVVWLTDHDTLAARADPGEGRYGSVLLLVGTEMTPPTDHLLCLGTRTVPDRSRPWAESVQAVMQQGGLALVAHPEDPGNRRLKLPSYRWTQRDVRSFTGLEVWNHLSQWMRPIRGLISGVSAYAHPWRNAESPDPAALHLWDDLGRERRVVGVAGIDAHAVRVGPLTVFPYRLLFRTALTHVLLDDALTGDATADTARLVSAIGRGRVQMVNGYLPAPRGFRFWAEAGGRRLDMGGEDRWRPGWRVRATSPIDCWFRLQRDGVAASVHWGRTFDDRADEPGVWRLEAYRPGRGRAVPWLFTNPVYLRA